MKLISLTLVLSLALSRMGSGAVLTGTIDNPNDVDTFRVSHAPGDFVATITADPTLVPYVGLFNGNDQLLALTGPGESLSAIVAGGTYRLVVTGDGVGNYTITVPGATVVPEPAAAVVLVLSAAMLRRRRA